MREDSDNSERSVGARKRPHPFLAVVLLLLLGIGAGCAKYPNATQSLGGSATGEEVCRTAKRAIGARYRLGGDAPAKGFDCSGLVCWVYSQHGIKLPRTTREQLNVGMGIRDKRDLRPGDIVVFRTSSGTGLHTGIYTGDGKFLHSPSTGKRVRIESMEASYYKNRFIGGRRPKQLL